MNDLLEARAREAKGKSDWYAGRVDRHPQGKVLHLLPKELTSNCWDTHPGGLCCSEWGWWHTPVKKKEASHGSV